MVIEDIGHETRPAGLMCRLASLGLPTDGLIEIVFAEALIDLGCVPVACTAGRCDLGRLGRVSCDRFSALRIHASLEIQPNHPWFGARGS
jgi:hypothetical protein